MNNAILAQTDFNTVGNSVSGTLLTLWYQFVAFIPQLIGAIVIFIVGYIIAVLVGSIVRRILRAIGTDRLVRRDQFEKANMNNVTISGVMGKIVKWFIIVAFLIPVADALKLPEVSAFLGSILLYIPNIIAAAAILAIGFYLAEALSMFISSMSSASKMTPEYRNVLRRVGKYSVIVFSIMAALVQLRVVPELVQIILAGLVLALALAFGLGGREHARDLISAMRGRDAENRAGDRMS